MTGTHYVTATSLTPEALLTIWRAIPADRQEALAVKVLAHHLAELLADDDGLVSFENERDAAYLQSHETFGEISEHVEAALPCVLWHYPEGFRYEARDRQGAVLGTVEEVSNNGTSNVTRHTHRFRPAKKRTRSGPVVRGEPRDCLPDAIRALVADGGWFGAVLPDGRRYPDDLAPLTASASPA